MKQGSYKADFLIVGAGLAGSVFARTIADAGYTAVLIDKRDHVGGNCYTYVDEQTGITVHKYGPHIFHTNSTPIWEFVNRFANFMRFNLRTKAIYGCEVYSFPINLMTVNQFFHKALSPTDARRFIRYITKNAERALNMRQFLLSTIGQELYETFYWGYTVKQWGMNPEQIPVSIGQRLPIRYTYDDRYFDDIYEGIPADGYTAMFNNMLAHDNIKVILGEPFSEHMDWRVHYKHLVFTGSLDEYFNYEHGYLPYRTVRFETIRDTEIQGNAIINYTSIHKPYTRIHEHKWFMPHKKFNNSIAFAEYAYATDSRNEPYYPMPDAHSQQKYAEYEHMAMLQADVSFLGRLADYKYYNMDQVIARSIHKAEQAIQQLRGLYK